MCDIDIDDILEMSQKVFVKLIPTMEKFAKKNELDFNPCEFRRAVVEYVSGAVNWMDNPTVTKLAKDFLDQEMSLKSS